MLLRREQEPLHLYRISHSTVLVVEANWNVMAHAQKPGFVFRRNGRVHLNRRGRQFSRLLAAEVCALALIVGSNAGYTVFRGSKKGTGYPLHSSVSPSLPLPCVTACHHVSSGVYDDFKVTHWKGFGNERSRPNKTHVIMSRPFLVIKKNHDRPQSRNCVSAEFRTWHLPIKPLKQTHWWQWFSFSILSTYFIQ